MPRKHPTARTGPEPTDRQLLQRLRQADEAAFNRLYERYFDRVYAFVYARMRNHADAEEVVQETFTAVFRSIHAFRGKSSLSSWIYGIAKNNANNHLRRSRAHELRIERAEPELVRSAGSLSDCTPEEHASLRRCADAMGERLSSVAEWQAQIFVMRHLDDMSIAEISRRMSRSNDAVRSSLYRVKRMLMEAVDPHLHGPKPAMARRSA